MKKKIIIIALAAVMLFAGCAQPADQNDAQSPVNTQTEGPQTMDEVMLSLADAAPKSHEGISDIQLGFNLNLLKKLSESEEGNLFYSPMSINAAMTMAYFGAQGETQQEIADGLGYGDAGMELEDVAAYQKYLLKSYEDSGDTTFTTANSIWTDDMFSPKQSYMDTMKDVFKTKVTKLDLQAEDAADRLNAWIDESTEGMIKKLFDKKDPLLSIAEMILMNAIYFNGDWTSPFDPEKTFDATFTGQTVASDIKMMSSSKTVMGHEGEDYLSVFLPYGEDERFAMVAVLPDDMNSFVEGLAGDSLSGILSAFEEKEESLLQLPVFEMEREVKLGDALKALGIKRAFEGGADFSLIAEGLFIDEVLHKAKIKVDEEGTEAAAVTAVVMSRGAMPEDRFEFIADKPFLFFIMDTENDLVLFTGKVLDLD